MSPLYGYGRSQKGNKPIAHSRRIGPRLIDLPGGLLKTRRGKAMNIAHVVGLSWRESRQMVDAMRLPNRQRHGRLTDEEVGTIRQKAQAILKARHK